MVSKKRNKPFVPRWKPATNTFELAATRAAKIDPATLTGLAESLKRSCGDLTVPEKSAMSWQDLRLAVVVSRRVERMGVVKGLTSILDAAFEALESIRVRCTVTGAWRYCQPKTEEIAAIVEMCEIHAFQLRQISSREFELIFLQSREDSKRCPRFISLVSPLRRGEKRLTAPQAKTRNSHPPLHSQREILGR